MAGSISDLQSQQLNAVTKVVQSANPAAGAEMTLTVPAGKTWLFLALRIILVTSAAVANRIPSLVFDDGANIFTKCLAGTTHPASITAEYDFGDYDVVSSGALAANGVSIVATPAGLLLPAGYRIRTITAALDAADDYGVGVALVKEF